MQSYSLKAFKAKLLKLQLLKSQVCKKKSSLKGGRIENVTLRLKKLINIVSKFHTFNKRMLFVGASLHKQQRLTCLTLKTKHTIVSKYLRTNGVITNRPSKIKPDLIVVLDEFSNPTVLKEGYVYKIPLSSLNADFYALKTKVVYKVPGNLDFAEENCLFYSVLRSVLKKIKSDQT